MIIDTHTHYHHRRFSSDRAAVLEHIRNAGVSKIIEVPISLESNNEVARLASEYPWIYPAFGIHPNQTVMIEQSQTDFVIYELRHFFEKHNAVAIGEIGLDYKRVTDEPQRKYQRQWFETLLELGIEAEKPIILHVREAPRDALDILESFNRCFSGVVHCYSEDREIAKEYIDMGFALGVGGSLTYDTADNVRDAVKYAPSDMLLLETDAPFLTPVGCEGKNNSGNISAVISVLASIRNEDEEQIIWQTTKNAEMIFGI